MKEDKLRLIGRKGEEAPDPPVEEPDSLQSKATARIVDLICEGEIQGWANDNNLLKSLYFNEVPVMNADGVMQFEGVTVEARKGTPNQDYLAGYDAVETESSGPGEVKYSDMGKDVQIADSDVDDVRVTLAVNGFLVQEEDGDLRGTTVNYHITVTPDGGAEQTAITSSITGKTTSTYQKGHTITNLSAYGSAPWTIKVYRDTEDSTSIKLNNKLYFSNYTQIKNVKLRYSDSVVAGVTLDAQKFGGDVPYRYYYIQGMKTQVPSGYQPSAAGYGEDLYPAIWNGEFETKWHTNPVWVLYDLLINKRYGLGLDPDLINKWDFYTAAIYCDGEITYKEKVLIPPPSVSAGLYETINRSERRFTFNGIIADRRQALEVINHLASVVGAFPILYNGQISLVQDRPKTVSRVASPANVLNGEFSYEGSPRGVRHTVCRVQYNNPENFGKPDVIVLQDDEGLATYGYNPIDIVAFGCNSRNEAIRRAKMLLYTDLEQNEVITFMGGIEWATAQVGEVIAVQDPDVYVSPTLYSGRIISATTTSITVPSAQGILIEAGKTYKLHVQTEGDAAEVTLTNTSSIIAQNVLTWDDPLDYAPLTDFNWVVYCTTAGDNETARYFMISGLAEVEFGIQYRIQGILYDPNKWLEVENNLTIIAPQAPTYKGEIAPPTSPDAQVFTYSEGAQGIRKYGVVVSWVASDDPRVNQYEVRYRYGESYTWNFAGLTGQTSFTIKDLIAGSYDFSIRAKGLAGNSIWVNLADIVIVTALDAPPPPRNLQVFGGGTTFSGKDCHIEWDSPLDSTYTDSYVSSAGVGNANLQYKVEVYKIDDTLLRQYRTASKDELEYIYQFNMNNDDNNGSPIRQIKFKVYTVDFYGTTSVSAATLIATNPAPSMASSKPIVTPKTGFLKVEWALVSDNDMSYYSVFYGTSPTNPNTLFDKVTHPQNLVNLAEVNADKTYYVKVIPFDLFGQGTASQISDGATPLTIPITDIETELEESVKIIDNIDTDIETLRRLYDHDYDGAINGSVYYNVNQDIFIEYRYGLNNYIDRIAMWSGGTAYGYCSYSLDGENFDFLKYKGIDANNMNALDYADDETDAKANYFTLQEGKNTFMFPNNIVAKYVRIHLFNPTGNYNVELFEALPSRLIVSELAALEFLSAISANIGTITAGNIQSLNFGPTAGMNIDLDSKQIYLHGSDSPSLYYDDATDTLSIKATVEFKSGSGGYTNIDDAPTELGDLDPDAASKLDGIEDGATDDSAWRADADTTLIDGGKLYIGSVIQLSEGGKATFGNQNVIINTVGSKGSIIIAQDGGPSTNDYCLLSDGDISFFYYDSTTGTHLEYSSLKRIESGEVYNNEEITLPGIWKEEPEIALSPKSMTCYDSTYRTQSQNLVMEVSKKTEFSPLKWKFIARAKLELTSGTYSVGGGLTSVTGTYWKASPNYWETPAYSAIPSNTTLLYVTTAASNWQQLASYENIATGGRDTQPYYVYNTYLKFGYSIITLYYQLNGLSTWYSAGQQAATNASAYNPKNTTTHYWTVYNGGNYITALKAQTYYYYLSGYTLLYPLTNLGSAIAQSVSIAGFSSTQSETSYLAQGTLNWIAIGK